MKQAESCEKSLDGRRGVNWIYERKDSGTNGGRVAKRGPETLEGVEWKAESRGRVRERRSAGHEQRYEEQRVRVQTKVTREKRRQALYLYVYTARGRWNMLRDEVEG